MPIVVRILLSLALLACLPAQSAAAAVLEPVSLQLKWTHAFQFAGYYVAAEKGYYRDAGLVVSIRESTPGLDVVDEVVSGKAEFGVGTSSLLLARHAGKPVVALAVIFQHSPQVLIARQRSDIKEIGDLAGKRLMLEPQSEELLAYLQNAGIPTAGLDIRHHSLSLQELIDGKVDALSAYSTSETWFLDQARLPYQVFTPRAAGIDFYGDNLFTDAAYLRAHPQRVKAFVAASLRGWQYAMEHPDEVAILIQRKYSAAHPIDFYRFEAAQMAPLIRADLVEIGYMNPERWQHIADVYAELGLLPSDFSLDGFLHHPRRADNQQMLLYLILALCLLALTGGIALHIFRLNRKLAATVEQSRKSEIALRPLSIATEQSPATIVITDLQGNIEYVNPRFTATTGYPAAEVLGQNPRILNSGQTPPQVYTELWASLRRHEVWSGEFINRRKDGTIYWEEAHICPVIDDSGTTLQYVAIKLDISERKRAEQRETMRSQVLELLATGASLETVLNAIVLSVEKDHPTLLCSILLLDAASGRLRIAAAPNMPEDYTRAFDGLEIGPEVGSSGTAVYTGKRVIIEDVQTHPYWRAFRSLAQSCGLRSSWAEPIRAPHGTILGALGLHYRNIHLPTPADISLIEQAANLAAITIERWQSVEALRVSEERHRLLADNASDVIWTMDLDGRFTYISPSVERLRGYTPSEIMQRDWHEALTTGALQTAGKWLEDALVAMRNGRSFPPIRGEFEQPHKNGGLVWVESQASCMRNASGKFIGILGVTRDISARKRAEEHIKHLAQHDPLTDLPNRALLDDRLQQTLLLAERENGRFALVFIDLDCFKPVNDHFGHAVGDQLLQACAVRMLECIRASDTLARIGGDEFVVLLPAAADAEGTLAVAEKIRGALNQPFDLAGHRLQISCSIGFALYPEHGTTALELARNADSAMYAAKENGRDKVVAFELP